MDFRRATSTAPMDFYGRPFKVGDKVLKPTTYGRAASLEERVVIRVEGEKVVLDGSRPVALNYPSRCVIVNDIHRAIDPNP